jgi:DNA polymerase-4
VGKQDGRDRQVTVGEINSSTAPILHVDMDAFFASVELLDHPELVGQPVIVGHNSPRSIVTAATYEARRFGVNSALPMAIALRRCPQAVILEPHYERYQHYSRQVFAICDELTPAVERLGIDEAFLDVSGAGAVFGSPQRVAELLRARVRAETGLICSVGAAATKYVAKVASGLSKPDGLLVIPRDATIDFLHPLPVAKLWGVGAKTEESLRARGLHTIGDVAQAPLDVLRRAVGEAGSQRLHDLAWGRDERRVHGGADEKSVGHEMTFSTDIQDPVVVRRELLRLSNNVAARLRRQRVRARTVVLKLRYSDFTTITRSRTLPEPTDLGRQIFDEVQAIYETVRAGDRPVRLVGVRGEQLVDPAGIDQALWDDTDDWRHAENAMDAAIEKFGRGAITPARLLGHRSIDRPRHGQRD